jgi:teichoic acid transport system ATP-binding protein
MAESAKAITEFAGLEEFIDLPMRTYSSGMSARLRFAIAASRDHDILIVDEALAVGDQEFRNRSEARMREMRDNAGTLFLVSHSMQSILDTCTRVIWIEKGEMMMDGEPKAVVNAYNQHTGSTTID